MKIILHNRDGANLWLQKIEDLEDKGLSKWELKVDDKHKYCLQYMRVIGDYPLSIEAVDPSGGPYISISDEFEGKYKIVNIINPTIFIISERHSNN